MAPCLRIPCGGHPSLATVHTAGDNGGFQGHWQARDRAAPPGQRGENTPLPPPPLPPQVFSPKLSVVTASSSLRSPFFLSFFCLSYFLYLYYTSCALSLPNPSSLFSLSAISPSSSLKHRISLFRLPLPFAVEVTARVGINLELLNPCPGHSRFPLYRRITISVSMKWCRGSLFLQISVGSINAVLSLTLLKVVCRVGKGRKQPQKMIERLLSL